ncbi:hypothetical protein VS883_28765, partial [Escherichia coli]
TFTDGAAFRNTLNSAGIEFIVIGDHAHAHFRRFEGIDVTFTDGAAFRNTLNSAGIEFIVIGDHAHAHFRRF